MSAEDEENLAWGVDFNSPEPRKKRTWSVDDQPASTGNPPARRNSSVDELFGTARTTPTAEPGSLPAFPPVSSAPEIPAEDAETDSWAPQSASAAPWSPVPSAPSDDSDADLDSLFGDSSLLPDVVEAPTPPPVPVPVATETKVTSGRAQPDDLFTRRDHRPARETLHVDSDSVLARYIYQDDFYQTVNDILGLALSGDPVLQGTIASFHLTRDPELDAHQRATYEHLLSDRLPAHGIRIGNPADYRAILDIAYDELLGIGPLGPLWRDENIADIIVCGYDHVSVERDGVLVRTPVRFRDKRHLQDTARRLSTKVDDRGVSRSNPIVTVQLPGARVQIIWEPIAVSGADLVIRKHRSQLTLDQLLEAGALTAEMVAFISDLVSARATLLVSGATGSGKTTYLNIASRFIPDSERVIVIEDARELKLDTFEVDYLLTKEAASADDTVIVGMDRLLRAALRMRPDRIIVGEILDAKGAQAMLEAAFTGHDGTMTTLHANGPDDALIRVADLLRQATGMPEQLARTRVFGTFDAIVHVIRGHHGKRFVASICEVLADGSTNQLFTAAQEPGTGEVKFVRTARLTADGRVAHRLAGAGIDPGTWEA